MNARGYIGMEQMEKFRALMASTNETIAPNYRDIQSNPNNVYLCSDDESVDIGDQEVDVVNDPDGYKQNLFRTVWKENRMAVVCLVGGCMILLIIGLGICVCRRLKGLSANGMTRIAVDDLETDGVPDDDQMEIEIDDNQQLIQ